MYIEREKDTREENTNNTPNNITNNNHNREDCGIKREEKGWQIAERGWPFFSKKRKRENITLCGWNGCQISGNSSKE